MLLNVCEQSNFLSVIMLIKYVISFISLIVPAILIVSLAIELMKVEFSSNPKFKETNIIKKIIATVLLLFTPLFANIILSLATGSKIYEHTCWTNANNETISYYRELEEQAKKEEEEKLQIEKEKAELEREKVEKKREEARQRNQKRAEEEQKKQNISGLKTAELAVRVAPTAKPEKALHTPKDWTQGGPWCKKKDSRLYDYFKIMDAVIGKYHGKNNPPKVSHNNAYASCAQAAAGMVRATVDPDFETAGPDRILSYMKRNPKKWTLVKTLNKGESFDVNCQPGDVLLVYKGSTAPPLQHVMLYVGNKQVRTKFPKSYANIFEASFHSNQYPTLSYHKNAYAKTDIWRSTGYLDSYYPLINVESVLNGPVDLKKNMC